MLRRTLVAVASALALIAPVAASATPTTSEAKPNRAVAKDQTDDVWVWVPGEKIYVLVEGGYPAADVLKAVVTHWADKVSVTMKLDNLKKQHKQSFGVKIKTPELTRVAWVYAGPGGYKGWHRLEKDSGKQVSAKGMTHGINYKQDVVRMSIPRTLLSDPEWIRVAMVNLLYTAEGGEFVDHPANDQALYFEQWKNDPPLTAKLYPAKPS